MHLLDLQVLLSCMHQKDLSIIRKSNLSDVNTLVINQCDVDKETITVDKSMRHTMINTNTRGVSISRNIAIDKASGDICVISDDDEVFIDGFQTDILDAYKENPEADIIIFNLVNRHQKLGSKKRWLKKYDLLRVASWQISFKCDSIRGLVRFDEKLGAGTGNGGGEENKFLFDCRRQKKRILYVPKNIAVGIENQGSTWFFGYSEEYFYKLGVVIKYILGTFVGFLYCQYTIVANHKLYKEDISCKKALFSIINGFFNGDLA